MIGVLVAIDVVLGLAVALNLLLTLALIRRVGQRSEGGLRLTGLEPGEPAPDFEAETLDASPVAASDLARGRSALLFISPGCQPCKDALPQYVELAGFGRASGIGVFLVSDGDVETTRDMIGRIESPPTVIVAPRSTNDLFSRWRVPATPHFVVVQDGVTVVSGPPSKTYPGWRNLLAELSSGVPA